MVGYIILDLDSRPLEYVRDGFYAKTGKILCIGDAVTVFSSERHATAALLRTKRYASRKGLDRYWKTSTWKTIQITLPPEVNGDMYCPR
jgi:hypothetical protein